MKLGLGKSNNDYKNINIVDGTFRLRIDENHPQISEAITRNLTKGINAGREVKELAYHSLTGYIKDIKIRKTPKMGTRMQLFISDTRDMYVIDTGYASGEATAIYKMLPNIDPVNPVEISISRKKNDQGREVTSVFMREYDENDDGQIVKHAYTKDNPNGIPNWEQKQIQGEMKWDNTSQIEFLIENALNPFLEKLGKMPIQDQNSDDEFDTVDESNEADEEVQIQNPDDVPF